ncbi:lytic transglycosylase domain-containing protein [Brevibacterium sp. 91QC2O2]|uniref:lytic transglycosylase domain-containing protein n=1 Tax=Brevibacterium sp. 91QC2O2 TaxID=2968458 RepID=UPI00211C823A|nr:lytic transglycosylase domain-containing protein [Brevibacterium sp. 91QC2O2]
MVWTRGRIAVGIIAFACVGGLIAVFTLIVLPMQRTTAAQSQPAAAEGRANGAAASDAEAPAPGAAGSGEDGSGTTARDSSGTAAGVRAKQNAAADVASDLVPIGAESINASWLSRQAGVTGIPHRVLLGYVTAANWIDQRSAGCNLDWSTLAGIGYVESHHGTIYSGQVEADGVTRPKIVGVQLDGVKTAHIADSDGGEYDGDARYDRAVGPMQFIPGTWRKSAVDGNGDGKKDPQNIDDAAFTAAQYLCAGGKNLAAGAAWRQAILSYNNSPEYVAQVSSAAQTIATNSRAAG